MIVTASISTTMHPVKTAKLPITDFYQTETLLLLMIQICHHRSNIKHSTSINTYHTRTQKPDLALCPLHTITVP